jgi:hypothetical protein
MRNLGWDRGDFGQDTEDNSTYFIDIRFLPPQETVPVNFDDLLEPVAATAYYDARWLDCWNRQTHCATITEDSHRPGLSVKNDFWKKLMPNLGSCVLLHVNDPPIALTMLDSAALDIPSISFPANHGAEITAAYEHSTEISAERLRPGGSATMFNQALPTGSAHEWTKTGQDTERKKGGSPERTSQEKTSHAVADARYSGAGTLSIQGRCLVHIVLICLITSLALW